MAAEGSEDRREDPGTAAGLRGNGGGRFGAGFGVGVDAHDNERRQGWERGCCLGRVSVHELHTERYCLSCWTHLGREPGGAVATRLYTSNVING